MMSQTFRYFQNTGGLNLRHNELTIGEQQAEEILNLHATSNGSWTTQGAGYVRLNTTALASGAAITSMAAFQPLQGAEQLLVAAGDALHVVATGDGSAQTIASGLSVGAPVNVIPFQGLLIACNGVNAPLKWDGSGDATPLEGWPAAIVGIAPGAPAFGEVYANRLVLAGDPENPSMVYISALEDPQTFTPTEGATSAGALQVSPGDGQRITALKTLYLPLSGQQALVIFKDRSTYLLTGDDTDTFALQKLSGEFGAVGPRAVVAVGNELLFMTYEGVTSLNTATLQGNITTQFLSQSIQPQINLLNGNRLKDSVVIHLRQRQEVWWMVPEGGSTRNQRVLVYHYGLGNVWSRRSGIEAACGVLFNGKFYTGDYHGYVCQQLTGNSYHGAPIEWRYRTPFYSLGSARVRKRIKDIEISLKQISSVTLSISVVWDYRRSARARQYRQRAIAPTEASAVYQTAVYGADEYGVSGASLLRIMPDGSGRSVQLEFSGASASQPVELQGWTITALYGGFR